MKTVKLNDLNILDVGNAIQLYGAIYTGNGQMYLVPTPDEDPEEVIDRLGSIDQQRPDSPQAIVLVMNADEWQAFLRQTDVLDVQGPDKAIVRKTQRQVDQSISWEVYRRDDYTCRYCARNNVPLTVDHIDLWEDGGATVAQNLITACRRCNKVRGRLPYQQWMESEDYARFADGLTRSQIMANNMVISRLPELYKSRGRVRSR